MQDEAREVVFPNGVPVRVLPESKQAETQERPRTAVCEGESAEAVTNADGQLHSEAGELKREAEHSRLPSPDRAGDGAREARASRGSQRRSRPPNPTVSWRDSGRVRAVPSSHASCLT